MSFEIRKINESKGSGMFATRDIRRGEAILEEDPLVCAQLSWNEAYGYAACHHCLKPLETAEENVRRLTGLADITLPHPECCTIDKRTITPCPECGVRYCSEECLAKAYQQYHRTLCKQTDRGHPLYDLIELWKSVHFPPETSTIMIIPRIIATVQQASDRDWMLQQFMGFSHKTENVDAELAHKLLGERFTAHVQELQMLLESAVGYDESQILVRPGFRSLLALIATNGQGVGTTAIGKWATNIAELPVGDDERQELDALLDRLYENMDQHAGMFLNNEGVALYALQSKCNHDCEPNAEATFPFNTSRLRLMATEDIPAGEEIRISYLDECKQQRSRHSRQKELSEQYLFVCDCRKCAREVDQPDVTSSDEEEEEDYV